MLDYSFLTDGGNEIFDPVIKMLQNLGATIIIVLLIVGSVCYFVYKYFKK